MVDKMAAMTKF